MKVRKRTRTRTRKIKRGASKGVPPETAQKIFFTEKMLKELVTQLRPKKDFEHPRNEKEERKKDKREKKKERKKKKKKKKRSADTTNHSRMYTFA